jgi:hypothetical protein
MNLLMNLVQTAMGITTAIMAAACHPLAQAKVHEELDMIIGSDRGKDKKENILPSRLFFGDSANIQRLELAPSIARVPVGGFEMETCHSHR